MTPLEAAQLPLRDIHLPLPIAWWPPAPGWWLAASLVIVLSLGWTLQRRWHRRRALRRAAWTEFCQLRNIDDPHCLAMAVALLLRRVSQALDPTLAQTPLHDTAWLARLDQIAPGLTADATLHPALLQAPYDPTTVYDQAALLRALERWLQALPLGHQRVSHV